jgi:hypothetical protein
VTASPATQTAQAGQTRVMPPPPPERVEPDDRYRKRVRKAFRDAYEEGLYHDITLVHHQPSATWRVPSRSEPGVEHTVIRYAHPRATPDDPWRYACTCKAGEFHHVCRHRAAVRIAEALAGGYALEYAPSGDLEAVKRIELVKEYR